VLLTRMLLPTEGWLRSRPKKEVIKSMHFLRIHHVAFHHSLRPFLYDQMARDSLLIRAASMKTDHKRCPFSWSDFLKNQSLKFLGSSLGVNRMWIKKNDHAPRSACVVFLVNVQKGQFFNNNSSLIILLSSSFSQKKFHNFFIVTTFLCHGGPLAFFSHSTSFASPTSIPVGPC
jgi:hypothetical protein